MKAWLASDKNGDYGNEVVFAETRGKAIAEALTRDNFEDLDFTDIRVRRCSAIDGMEGNEPTDDYWFNDKIRLILVKDEGLRCSEPNIYEPCSGCYAKEYCSEWEYIQEMGEE